MQSENEESFRTRVSPRVRRMRSLLALLALTMLFAPVTHTSSAPGRSFFVGVDEDSPKWGRSRATVAAASTLGLKAIRITATWRPGESRLSGADRSVLDEAIIGTQPLRVVVAVYGRADDAPQDEIARNDYCSYATDLLRRYPAVRDVVVWNEPNSARFWQPQFNADGTSAAPAAYQVLLAQCWTMLHAVRPAVNVIAASAPRGNDDPRAGSAASHAPGRWYRELGAAYRSSGRRQPIFDTVGHNPYPDFSSERPWTRHPNSRSIAQGDHEKLTRALEEAFRSTGQPLPGQGRVSIWYMEQGFQTTIDRAKQRFYTGRETDSFALPARSASAGSKQGLAPDQATQLVDAIRLAYCQPNVGAYFTFLLADERDLYGWQSGVLWADWTPKPSHSALMHVVQEINGRAVDCAALRRSTALPPPSTETRLELSNIRVTALSPLSATIAWRTSIPTGSWLAYGPDEGGPTLWHVADGSRLSHSVTLSGLSFATAYRVWVSAVGPDGQEAVGRFQFKTPALSGPVRASVARRTATLLVESEPFFPLMVWSQCPGDYGKSLAVGVNLFAENPCGDLQDQLEALAGRALSAGVSGKPGGSGPGLIGFFHPDEADGFGLNASMLPEAPSGTDTGVSFLTLTNHFYSGAEPLAWGRDMYPGLIAAADVVGFDLYPLQEWCRPSRVPDVYFAQQELAELARGKPTYQWIEAAEWRCPGGQTAVTPATVRAEAWLAIAGGARGLGFFPANWSSEVSKAIARISRDIAKLGPALFSLPARPATTSQSGPVKVGLRSYLGALYIIAVNSSQVPAEASIRVPGLNGRPLTVLDEGRRLDVEGDVFSDSFAPLAVHIYIAPPPGTSSSGP